MSWYKKASSNMYHATKQDSVGAILSQGLKVNSPYNLTTEGSWATEHYGVNPIFLSFEKEAFEGIPLCVNTDGLDLVVDLPSLVETGAYVEEGGVLWWEEGNIPSQLLPFLEEGATDVETIFYDPEMTRICISLTRTAACLNDISPDRIKLC